MSKKRVVNKSLVNNLLNSYNEKDVENNWREILNVLFPYSNITSPYNVDGILENKSYGDLKILLEFKDNLNLTKIKDRSRVIIQSIFYVKKLETNGEKLPNIILIADKNECFVIHSNSVLKYLKYTGEVINWNSAPSSAYKDYRNMLQDIEMDSKFQDHCFVFNITETFDFNELFEKIKNINDNIISKTQITAKNVNNSFETFLNVLNKKDKNVKKLNHNDIASIFMDCIINPKDNFLHPKKDNILIYKKYNELKVFGSAFRTFWNQYEDQEYTIKQKQELVSIKDRLIEDVTRKAKGEFFTPTEWVDEAHKMISENFGQDWKEQYVVWDCASGTLNLTRDYKFSNLFCSTLEQSDIDTARQMKNNKEAMERFQYDFLNQDLEELDYTGNAGMLLDAFREDKPIIFFINPPYAKATPINGGGGGKNISATEVGKEMIKNKLGISSSQLYTQFLYKILKIKKQFNLTNINICIFCKSIHFSGDGFSDFRKKYLKEFKYIDGMLFRANHFSDIKGSWGIDFSIMKTGETENKEIFLHTLKDTDKNNNIIDIGKKIIYNLDYSEKLNNYVFNTNKLKRDTIVPNFKSGLAVVDKNNKVSSDYLGSINNHSNNQMQQRVVYVSSGAVSANGHKPINKDIFLNVCSLLVARKSIPQNWINDKDEYIKPKDSTLSSKDYLMWQKDSIVYFLFNSCSNQSSMREVSYHDKEWNIFNEFFFMSKEEMTELSEQYTFNDMEEDIENHGNKERFVYELLEHTELSDDTSEVLEMAKSIVRKSFKYREKVNDESEDELHLQSWDAGWYQIKKLINECGDVELEDELKEFNILYKKFESRMREGVYKFEFLK